MHSFRRSSRETVSVLPWAQGSGAQSRAAWAPQWSHTLQGLLTHHPLPDTCLPWAVVVGFTFGSLSDLYRLVFGGDWHFDGGLLSTNHVAAPSILSGKKKTNQTFDIFLIMRTGIGEREGQIPFSQEAYSLRKPAQVYQYGLKIAAHLSSPLSAQVHNENGKAMRDNPHILDYSGPSFIQIPVKISFLHFLSVSKLP